ncbi:MAG: tRNA lysidine(34) synthetase TilS [Pseudomonadota bacterium]
MGKKEQTAAKITAEIRALTAETRLGVAVSGGGDSMALLAIASMAGLDLSAATVDHGLRPEASDEAGLVADFCRSSGIPHQTLRIPPLPDFGNISAAARTARYAALTAWAAKQDLTTVLLGHTRDDQAETVLLRLARGSGVDGLSAMSAVRHSHGLTWVRPMLAIARADLRAWLIDQGISWADDPTNDDASFDRVRVRQAMDALWPLGITSDRLVGTADILATQRLVLEDAASQLSATARRDGPFGDIRLSREHLAAARRDTSLRLLKRAIIDVSGTDYPPRQRSIDKVMDDILADTPAQTLGGCMLWTDGDDLVICREPAATKTAPIKPGQQTWDGSKIETRTADEK